VEAAGDITGARYAALGVIDRTGQALERFLTTGIEAETHAAMQAFAPRRRGSGLTSECVRGGLPLPEALRDELGPLVLAPAVQHLEV